MNVADEVGDSELRTLVDALPEMVALNGPLGVGRLEPVITVVPDAISVRVESVERDFDALYVAKTVCDGGRVASPDAADEKDAFDDGVAVPHAEMAPFVVTVGDAGPVVEPELERVPLAESKADLETDGDTVVDEVNVTYTEAEAIDVTDCVPVPKSADAVMTERGERDTLGDAVPEIDADDNGVAVDPPTVVETEPVDEISDVREVMAVPVTVALTVPDTVGRVVNDTVANGDTVITAEIDRTLLPDGEMLVDINGDLDGDNVNVAMGDLEGDLDSADDRDIVPLAVREGDTDAVGEIERVAGGDADTETEDVIVEVMVAESVVPRVIIGDIVLLTLTVVVDSLLVGEGDVVLLEKGADTDALTERVRMELSETHADAVIDRVAVLDCDAAAEGEIVRDVADDLEADGDLVSLFDREDVLLCMEEVDTLTLMEGRGVSVRTGIDDCDLRGDVDSLADFDDEVDAEVVLVPEVEREEDIVGEVLVVSEAEPRGERLALADVEGEVVMLKVSNSVCMALLVVENCADDVSETEAEDDLDADADREARDAEDERDAEGDGVLDLETRALREKVVSAVKDVVARIELETLGDPDTDVELVDMAVGAGDLDVDAVAEGDLLTEDEPDSVNDADGEALLVREGDTDPLTRGEREPVGVKELLALRDGEPEMDAVSDVVPEILGEEEPVEDTVRVAFIVLETVFVTVGDPAAETVFEIVDVMVRV